MSSRKGDYSYEAEICGQEIPVSIEYTYYGQDQDLEFGTIKIDPKAEADWILPPDWLVDLIVEEARDNIMDEEANNDDAEGDEN
jgi:hypothetical protein